MSKLDALVAQLDDSQWWPSARIAAAQLTQRDALLAHAVASVPHYEGIFDWAGVPILTRDALIAAGPRLLSRAYPASHGPTEEIMTSRTTGEPVRVRGTGVTSLWWEALTLREHRWHGRDLHAHLAAIRYTGAHAPPPDGLRVRGWGPATAAIAPDAPMSVLSIASTTDEQLAWLAREAPAYLLIYPSALDALLRRGLHLPSLRQIRTISEALSPSTRSLSAVPIVDTYSAQEVGTIAMQCPTGTHYHVQSERLLVEILDDSGAPCAPGETGRVVITDLHNFATPILRYEIGDYATVGEPCACGRGLPVLTRVLGRRRGMLTYPDGRTTWPVFTIACRNAARYRELQLVQPALDRLIVRVVPLPEVAVDRAALAAALRATFAHDFTIDVELVETLGRTPAGKLEEFVSL
ncbi:MAG TPA: hypothetical protein VL463_24240, partial [Kofleriaceae bacterium]|nr:hypothetical protein [Kofleriaceae bacterium]